MIVSLVLATPAFAAPAQLPAGLVWVARAPGAGTATLHWVDRAGIERRRDLGYTVNAIACLPGGTILGLATSRAGERLDGGPHVVRFTTEAPVDDLGPVGATLATGYSAAAAGRDTLLVGTGSHLRGVRVAGGTPTLVGSLALPDMPYVGDWAVDPTTGYLLTVTAQGGTAQLVRLPIADPAAVQHTETPALPSSAGYGAVALASDRVLYALHNSGVLVAVPIDRPDRARRVAAVGAVESSDATFCAPPAPPAPPAPAAPAAPPALAPAKRRMPEPAATPVSTPVPPPQPVPKKQKPPAATVAAPDRPRRIGAHLIPILGGAAIAGVVAVRLARRRTR